MCLGIPMQVIECGDGYAWCLNESNPRERINTALIGDVELGQWILVFLGSAQEKLSDERAQEMLVVRSVLQRMSEGEDISGLDFGFVLPSSISQDQIKHLS